MFQTGILMTPELQNAVSLAENAIRLGWLKGDFDEATFNAFRQIIERGTEEVITIKFVLTAYFQLCLWMELSFSNTLRGLSITIPLWISLFKSPVSKGFERTAERYWRNKMFNVSMFCNSCNCEKTPLKKTLRPPMGNNVYNGSTKDLWGFVSQKPYDPFSFLSFSVE